MAVDINSPDFLKQRDISELNAVVGQIGHGYIGQAVEHLFRKKFEVLVYDKFKPGSKPLSELVSRADVIFVAVPTPMKQSGECHTGIVEEVLQDVFNESLKVGRDTQEFVIVIKSTVYPGFTKKMQKRHPKLRIVFSPEFLTEKNSIEDFANSFRVIFGGRREDALVLFKFFESVWSDRIGDDVENPVYLVHTSPDVAEMVKLFTNVILTTRVLFANEMYQICQKIDVKYSDVAATACLDPRINPSHLQVPGPDGNLGFGGHCFPKDINNLRHFCREIGVPEKLFTAVIERNLELRQDRNWEEMKGRAIVDDE